MKSLINNLLDGKCGNHILPFFWQHGEDEATLRTYMRVIDEANCKAVCVESRPHPDFCGPRWWQDMDVILDEARKRKMKVWILDDSHFPTGYANGAAKQARPEIRRWNLAAKKYVFKGRTQKIILDPWQDFPPKVKPRGMAERVMSAKNRSLVPFDDDRILVILAVNEKGVAKRLPVPAKNDDLIFDKPDGVWSVYIIGATRNLGPHRDYINMTDPESVKLLIDAVYEPHYAHYAKDFGKTIAGFFSDEPELGNGHLYDMTQRIGTCEDLPYSEPLQKELTARLGSNWLLKSWMLFSDGPDKKETAFIRHQYMDALTSLVRDNFSYQISTWCFGHGVRYIGHLIEDNNAHARLGPSLGHYFRGLEGQDMAGVDIIGGQVIPQGEDTSGKLNAYSERDGEFYHYQLANLAASAAAIEPHKNGNAMCEIFGNYGWAEGVQLEKYLTDHCLVRNINHFVPHAFSPKPFPDTDCPPHFYAGGNDAQIKHFGELMGYMNRAAELTSNGHHIATVAVLYHGEAEWAGEAMLSEKVLHVLTDAQINADTLPADVFARRGFYHTSTADGLTVHTQKYRALVIPAAECLTKAVAEAVKELADAGFPVYFIDRKPARISDESKPFEEKRLLSDLENTEVISLSGLLPALLEKNCREVRIKPENRYFRFLHYEGTVSSYFFTNESDRVYEGTVTVSDTSDCFLYDAWKNEVYEAPVTYTDSGMTFPITLAPRKSLFLIADSPDERFFSKPFAPAKEALSHTDWIRSVCKASDYPNFPYAKPVTFPDDVAGEMPKFSGFVRYTTTFEMQKNEPVTLEITDAREGVEVRLNGQSLGIQIVPPYQYNLQPKLREGTNELTIEVATTLERAMFKKFDIMRIARGQGKPEGGSGITGEVFLRKG